MELESFLTYALNVIIIIIAFYLIFLMIKSKNLRVYPCYNVLYLSIILFIDNILRLIPTANMHGSLQYSQAFILVCLDKLLLTTLVAQTIIIYLGVCKTNVYFDHERLIYFSTVFINLIIGSAMSIIFLKLNGKTNYDNHSIYYYCDSSDTKELIDTIFNSVFLFINTIFTIILLIYISGKKKDAKLGLIEDLDYGHHHTKIVFMFIINSLLFVESYLIINNIISNYVDVIYLISCIVIDIYYTMNKIIIKETMKIFCRKWYDKKYPLIKKNDSITDDDDEDDDNRKKNSSFSEDD
jgi:hypothetical protein